MRPTTQALLVILVLSVLTYLWAPADRNIPDAATAERQRQLPKTYLQEIRSWVYDDAGQLSEVLDARSAEYFEGIDETMLSEPKLYSHHADDRTWSASALRGRMHTDGEILDLNDNVILLSDQSGGRLETDAMVVELDNKVAIADTPVLIIQGGNTTRADGMIADLEKERLELKPNVESVYVQQEP